MDFITAINAGLAAKNIKDVGSKVVAGVKKKKDQMSRGIGVPYDPEDINNKEKEPTWTEPTASPSGSKKTRPTTPFVQTAAEKAELDNIMLGATTGGTELMNRPPRSQEAEDEIEFDKLVPGDFTDMGRTDAMDKTASEKFGGGVSDEAPAFNAPYPKFAGGLTSNTDRRGSTYDMSSPFLGTRGVQRMDNGAEAAMPKKSNPYGDFGGEPYDAAPTFETPNPNFAGALTGDADRKGVAPLDITTTASRAIPVETYETLFKKTHGGPFDPKSRVDREKMAVIQSMIDEDKSLLKLSPTQFALKVYGRK